ncbi:hypothetical protein ACFSKI_19650 [Pseudogracilibacillus auburnensis]|uniref:ABC-2 family transporter n=1 Tax=Pseudogracilibacillus auburnensis TaxID=1494959 RepID=A0A2V3VVT9_9BACI|nr:hypothetical protein [Pseudogracilibacillus auburnensis]PXW85114.1 hypothetical protein DFR56_11292 [Pseudogracilibacillus auburnensis]
MFTLELKKLFQPILLLVALLITIVFYNQDMRFILKHWPNGGMIPIYDQASEWQNRFGQTLEDAEIAEIEAEYATLVKHADKIVSENSIAKQLQLENYAEFESWSQENLPHIAINEMNEEEKEISKQFDAIEQDLIGATGHSMVDKIDVLQKLYNSMKQFDSSDMFLNNEHYSEKERERLSETLFMEEGWRNILPSHLTSTVAHHFERILILLIFLLSLLIPSVFVRDRLLGVQKIQWSSRHGRKILWTQFISGMTASFLLITCVMGFFGSLLYFTDFTQYFSNGLNSFFSDSEEPLLYSFYQWTLSQWIVNIVWLVYLIGMAYSGILLFLSQTSQHYLSLLMKIIPVAFVFIVIANRVLTDAFYLKNELYQWTKIPMIELYAGILLLVICISLPIIFCIRQQNQDLLD